MSSITRLSSSGPGCQERLSACSNTTVSSLANTRVARILAHLSAAPGSSDKSNDLRFHRCVSCVGGPVLPGSCSCVCVSQPALLLGTFPCIGGNLPSLKLSVYSSRYHGCVHTSGVQINTKISILPILDLHALK